MHPFSPVASQRCHCQCYGAHVAVVMCIPSPRWGPEGSWLASGEHVAFMCESHHWHNHQPFTLDDCGCLLCYGHHRKNQSTPLQESKGCMAQHVLRRAESQLVLPHCLNRLLERPYDLCCGRPNSRHAQSDLHSPPRWALGLKIFIPM